MLRLDGIVWTIVNLIFLYIVLRHFLINPIRAVIDKRQELVDKQFADAAKKEEEAAAKKAKYEDMVKGAHEESLQIVQKARETAAEEYDEKLHLAENQTKNMLEKAQKTVEVQKQQAMDEMQSQIAGLAMAAAKKILSENTGNGSGNAYDQFIKGAEAYDADSN